VGNATTVKKITETSGPTALTVGNIADGEFVKRSGSSLIGGTPGAGIWVSFDGTTAANVSGTYARTSPSTTLTITLTAHGYIVGNVIYADFTSGAGLDGIYTIVGIVDADNFTITTAASTTTSGNVTLLRRAINASSGIHSVTYQNSAGRFFINFSTAFTDANYNFVGTAASTTTAAAASGFEARTAQAFGLVTAPWTAISTTPTNFTRTDCLFLR
jgi:hypothetical protein